MLILPNLTYAKSTFLAKIIVVPILPKVPNIANFVWDLNLKLLSMRHEWRHLQDYFSQIYSNQLLVDCVWWRITFYAFWWFTSFKPIVKLLMKLENCLSYDVISNAYAFFIFHFNEKIYVSSHIAHCECANNIAPPLCILFVAYETKLLRINGLWLAELYNSCHVNHGQTW